MATILLVEDDPNQCMLYENELRGAGYDVVVARDGREAVSLCGGGRADVVVMDINMPGVDGMEAMGRMLGRNHKLPIILNTAYAFYKEDFRSWAADAYIIKSSDLTELKQTIQRVLESRRPSTGSLASERSSG